MPFGPTPSELTTLIISSVLPEKKIPTAVAKADPAFGIIGSVVKVDGRLSSDPDNNPLTYTWTFDSVPIGSRVIGEGFRLIDEDGGMVSFSPDVVGEYVIGLTVFNGMFNSEKSQTVSSIRVILVPHGRGIIPDGKWIWSYIRDVWQGVDNKETFETLWSALIQIVGSELLKLYEVDFNKSIRDIQDFYQRRWISYEPRLEILVNGPNFFFGNHFAGVDATTINLGLSGSLIIVSPTELVLVEGSILQNVGGEKLTIISSQDSINNRQYTLGGINASKNGYRLVGTEPVPDPTADRVATSVAFTFTLQGTNWQVFGSHGKPYAQLMAEYGSPLDYLLPLFDHTTGGVLDVQVGDVINFKTGPNKGFYRVVSKSGSFVTVDHAPPSFSDATTILSHTADVYRPVRFSVTQPDNLLTDTIALPFDQAKDISILAAGRVIIVNGETYTIVRASLDMHQRVPTVIVTTDRAILQSGLQGLSWRTPPTLVSTTQDFEADGVSTGDLIVFDIIQNGQEVSSVQCQVVGVDRGRLGFVFSNEPLLPGMSVPVPSSIILQLANDFHIDGVTQNENGTLSFSGSAAKFMDSINSTLFKSTYWNKELTPTTDITVNPTYQVKPRIIIRNKLIPVDDTLVSIPLLQNYIAPALVNERNGQFFQVKNGQEYKVKSPPMYLKENIDYIIDGDYAFSGSLTFETGSDIVEADDGDFIDRAVSAGDQFIIVEPVTLAKTYYVQAVLSSTKLRLTRPIPTYALSEFVTAKVKIKRKRSGHFIRFTPGQFSALKPAPDRLWGEVSFFDNNENIENNFGILVGLTRDDIASVSENLNYRQAVAGIMFAFLRGSAIEKVRLGAQILLGLPFAENRGIIRSIENDYRLDIHGSAVLGRLLIEDVDNVGQALGTLRVYTFPIEEGSILAGLETNPTTGALYKVGDIVEKFAALSKGVEVSDYVSNPLDIGIFSIDRILQQFHSVRIRINDNIFTLDEIGLVSSFLKKITPSYINFYISSLSEFFDTVSIQDASSYGIGIGAGVVVDNASLCIPPTMMLDSKTVNGVQQMYLDSAPYWVRRSGGDLQTADGTVTVTITAGGIVNHRTNEVFEAPLTKVGDLLLIQQGLNQGLYTIDSVTDTTIHVSDGPSFGFEDASNLRYAIVRPLQTLIRTGVSVSFTSGNPLVTFSTGGLRTDGVSPGDLLLNTGTVMGGPSKYTILEVLEGTFGSGVWNTLHISPTPGATGSDTFSIARSKIFESPFPTVFTITGAAGNKYTLPSNSLLKSLVDVGDELQVFSGGNDGTTYMVLDAEKKYIVPALAPATNATVRLRKKNRSSTGTGWDAIGLFDPIDSADVAIVETQALATCTSGSTDVSLQQQRTTAPTSGPSAINPISFQVRPTDFLKLTGMASSLNIGYGVGVFPIVEVHTTFVRLAVTLPTNETLPWSIIRRR